MRFKLSPAQIRKLAAEVRADWAEEAERLTETRAYYPMWLLAVKMNAPEETLAEIEAALSMLVEKEWGPEAVIDFSREEKFAAVEHPEKGVFALSTPHIRPPRLVKDENGEFYYEWIK